MINFEISENISKQAADKRKREKEKAPKNAASTIAELIALEKADLESEKNENTQKKQLEGQQLEKNTSTERKFVHYILRKRRQWIRSLYAEKKTDENLLEQIEMCSSRLKSASFPFKEHISRYLQIFGGEWWMISFFLVDVVQA